MNLLQLAVAAVLAASLAPVTTAATSAPVHPARITTVTAYDKSAEELPEGVAAADDGTVFVGFPNQGEVRRVHYDGTEALVARTPKSGTPFDLGGLALDDAGTLYAVVNHIDPARRGIYRIDQGSALLVSPVPDAVLLNDLTVGTDGHLYISDPPRSTIWQARPGRPAVEWARDTLLDPPADAPFPGGPNGLTEWRGDIYTNNTFARTIVRIDRRPNGTAGRLDVFARGLLGDGLTTDGRALYAVTFSDNQLLRIDTRGRITVLADRSDGLDFPASIDVAPTRRGTTTLYLTNYAFGPTGQRLASSARTASATEGNQSNPHRHNALTVGSWLPTRLRQPPRRSRAPNVTPPRPGPRTCDRPSAGG